MKIGIDVDLTVVDPSMGCVGHDWFSWLRDNSHSHDPSLYEDFENGVCDYNLSKYFQLHEGIKPRDFWKQRELYDNMVLYPEAVDVINRWCDQGHEVVFVSMCKGDHHKSKYAMLERHCPKMAGFVNTKQKKFVGVDVFIDDRNEFLNQVDAELRFKMATPYIQYEELMQPVIEVQSWKQLEKIFNWHMN